MADVSAILQAGNIPPAPNLLDQFGKMQSIQQSQQSVANMRIEGEQKQQELTATRNAYISGRLATLAYAGPEMQTPENYNKVLDEALHLHADPEMVEQFRQMIPGKTPQQLQELAFRSGMSMAPPQIQQQMTKPDRMTTDTGQEVRSYVIPQPGMPGQNVPVRTGQPTTQTYPSRATLGTQEEGNDTRLYVDGKPNPNYGHPIQTTLGGRLQQQGRSDLTGPAGQPPVNNNDGSTPSPDNPSRLNPPVPPAGGATGGSSPPPPATGASGTQPPPAATTQGANSPPPGSVYTGTPPGMAIPFKASSDLYAQHQQDTASYTERTFPLAKAYQLSTAPGVHSGPNTDFWTHIYATVQAQSPDWFKQHILPDMKENDKRQELDKYLSQNLMKMPFAKQSDNMMAQALTGTPGTHLTDVPLQDVIKAQYAMMRMQQAGTLAFQAEHPGLTAQASSGQYAQWLGDWQRNIDPRAFMIDMLTDKQRADLYSSFHSDAEHKRFEATFDMAHKLGLLDQKPPSPEKK